MAGSIPTYSLVHFYKKDMNIFHSAYVFWVTAFHSFNNIQMKDNMMHPSITTIIAIVVATSYAITTFSSSSVVVAFQSPIIHRSLPIAKSSWTNNNNIGAPINKQHHPSLQQQHYTTNTKLYNLKGGDYLDSLSNEPNSDDDGASSSEVKEVSASSSGTGTASIPNEIFNLVKSIVGAGVLSLPAGNFIY